MAVPIKWLSAVAAWLLRHSSRATLHMTTESLIVLFIPACPVPFVPTHARVEPNTAYATSHAAASQSMPVVPAYDTIPDPVSRVEWAYLSDASFKGGKTSQQIFLCPRSKAFSLDKSYQMETPDMMYFYLDVSKHWFQTTK
ncbi:hypothetical protein LY76DRAFT_607055 [Colletotrichum caudatum]|nr:hypothetical protein LY76DRAFT_607055 [Colletotrichum caudatum]